MLTVLKTFLNPYLFYIQIGVIALVVASASYAAYRYHKNAIAVFEIKLSVSEAEKAAFEKLANENAQAALKADADRRAAINALETAQAALTQSAQRSRAASDVIERAPSSDDAPVAPLLEALRKSRFGGTQ